MVNSAKPSFFDLFWFLFHRTCQEKKFQAFTTCPLTKSQRSREKQGAWTAFAMCPARKLCRSSREPQSPPGQSSLLASASRPPPSAANVSVSPKAPCSVRMPCLWAVVSQAWKAIPQHRIACLASDTWRTCSLMKAFLAPSASPSPSCHLRTSCRHLATHQENPAGVRLLSSITQLCHSLG